MMKKILDPIITFTPVINPRTLFIESGIPYTVFRKKKVQHIILNLTVFF